MAELHLEGWLNLNFDTGDAMLEETKEWQGTFFGELVAESVVHFAEEIQNGSVQYTEDYDTGDLGEYHAVIENVNLRIYATEDKCTLDEAMTALVDKIEGACEAEASLYGHSEFTIEGMATDSFTIGNHDIEAILKTYEGKYVHFVMEC